MSASAVRSCETVQSATLNDRSLAALEAGIDKIPLAAEDRRGKDAEFAHHQSRMLAAAVFNCHQLAFAALSVLGTGYPVAITRVPVPGSNF